MHNPTRIPSIISETKVVVGLDGKMYYVHREEDETRYKKAIRLVKDGDEDALREFFVPGTRLEKYSNDQIVTTDDSVYLREDFESGDLSFPMPDMLARRVLFFMENGLPMEPLVRFWRRLKQNPNEGSRQQLYAFLDKHNHPITDQGYFLAYKRVSENSDGDLWDSWTYDRGRGTFRNNPGDTPQMDREDVVYNPHKTCAQGLHVAAWDYAEGFYGGNGNNLVLIEVLVDPADVVSVPKHHNMAKMRTCRYKVLRRTKENITKDIGYLSLEDEVDQDFYGEDYMGTEFEDRLYTEDEIYNMHISDVRDLVEQLTLIRIPFYDDVDDAYDAALDVLDLHDYLDESEDEFDEYELEELQHEDNKTYTEHEVRRMTVGQVRDLVANRIGVTLTIPKTSSKDEFTSFFDQAVDLLYTYGVVSKDMPNSMSTDEWIEKFRKVGYKDRFDLPHPMDEGIAFSKGDLENLTGKELLKFAEYLGAELDYSPKSKRSIVGAVEGIVKNIGLFRYKR